jgi:hypothetical protein
MVLRISFSVLQQNLNERNSTMAVAVINEQSVDQTKKFEKAIEKFHKSRKETNDYVEFLQAFEDCCGDWNWGAVKAAINYKLLSI